MNRHSIKQDADGRWWHYEEGLGRTGPFQTRWDACCRAAKTAAMRTEARRVLAAEIADWTAKGFVHPATTR